MYCRSLMIRFNEKKNKKQTTLFHFPEQRFFTLFMNLNTKSFKSKISTQSARKLATPQILADLY